MQLEISREALERNARKICDYVGVPVIGVVKCDGYGVTLVQAARAWQQAGVSFFAVGRPEEALALRQAGFFEDILLLSPVADRQNLIALTEQNVILTVTGFDCARFYALNATRYPLRVHVAVDTGMGRFGIRWDDHAHLASVYSLAGLRFEGIFSHFSGSFEKTGRRTTLQLQRFLSAVDSLTEQGICPGIRHIANSAAALRFPETWLDAVRPGSALVGRLCCPVPIPLERVGVFRARIVDCKYFRPGDTTGYASLYTFHRNTKAIVVELGQRDGFGLLSTPEDPRLPGVLAWIRRSFRHARRLCVYHNGRVLPLLGRVGTQFTLFDATDTDLQPGDQVTWEGNILFPGENPPIFH